MYKFTKNLARVKKLIPLIVVIILAGRVSAQDKLTYTFVAGFSISSFDSRSAPHSTPELVEEFSRASRASLEVGINADLHLSDFWTLSSGLEYVERGGAYRTKNPGVIYVNQYSGVKEDDAYNYLKYRLSYLELPFRIKFDLKELIERESSGGLNVFAGPTAMLNLASKRRYNIFEGSGELEEKWHGDKLSGAKTVVFGLNCGVEWRQGPVTIYAKYLRNLTDLYDTSRPNYENFGTKMHSISLGMGFQL